MEATTPAPEFEEQRVTPLELFFDLVFVFGFTQVTTFMSNDPTWVGIFRGMPSSAPCGGPGAPTPG